MKKSVRHYIFLIFGVIFIYIGITVAILEFILPYLDPIQIFGSGEFQETEEVFRPPTCLIKEITPGVFRVIPSQEEYTEEGDSLIIGDGNAFETAIVQISKQYIIEEITSIAYAKIICYQDSNIAVSFTKELLVRVSPKNEDKQWAANSFDVSQRIFFTLIFNK